MSPEYKLTLAPRTINDATPRARIALECIQEQLGFIPNMYAVMANSPILLESYLYSYGLFRQVSSFTPIEQEVIFLTISRKNSCHYSVSSHSFSAEVISNVPVEVTDAIRNRSEIPDTKLQELSIFTEKLLDKHGRPSEEDVASFFGVGYKEVDILNILQVIGMNILSNYANHLFDTKLDDIFKVREWRVI